MLRSFFVLSRVAKSEIRARFCYRFARTACRFFKFAIRYSGHAQPLQSDPQI
jgi:hypothetical protein